MEESYPKTPPYLAGGTGRQRGGVLEREKMEREGGYMTIHVPIQ